MIVNLWIALSTVALAEFVEKRDNENYSGPMDDQTFKYLSTAADLDTVQNIFNSFDFGGKTYKMFSIYVEGTAAVQNAVNHLTTNYPDHCIVAGAWWWDGRQVGTEWEWDYTDPENPVKTGGTTGTPTYTINPNTYRLMPDVVTYDENGDEVSRTPATSNADLRDINILQGQEPRRFT